MGLQQEIIRKLGVKADIDIDQEIEDRVSFLKKHIIESKSNGLLVAISGGLDSAVVAALCKRATDELTQEAGRAFETIGLFQPYGEQEDIVDSYNVAKTFQLTVAETNIEDTVNEIALEVEYAMKSLGTHRHVSRVGKGNIMARSRMVMLYALAYERGLLVVGTDHASEIIAGFFTKYGDGAVDLMPLSSLTKRQVYKLAERLNVPDAILRKTPTAGFWSGQSDEEEMGVTYEDNCDYLEGKEIDPQAKEKLEKLFLRTEHKRIPIPRI